MTAMRRMLVRCAALLLAAAGAAAAAPPPGDSLYQTALALQDQQGRRFDFAALRGRPLLVSVFYASCHSACPLTIETIARARRAAGAGAPDVLMVSFDPAHDDVAALAAMAAMHRVDAAHWRLARPERGDVEAFAATLGVAYRPRGDGDFSHNVVIALLDADGRIVARSSRLGEPDAAFVAAVRRLAAAR
ncbi:SCO1/SenC family protein, cytochrome C oxidase assembly factor [Mizugakiibacter sediminis]|uniref:SCO1/SenC family protein, cytochrome C oxidase assembly factor n=1 Tax=Mizugakiibacter sediminis TaxID=1475481 RepID=A0A0K8QL44_9GAMM|nr:SCO family protein [Mizugakiibacter sediminis]GAP65608.1 SCO1/SenC family protein, cytochrome C oxidase assembly factor [Mizugakiibacter sediminis]